MAMTALIVPVVDEQEREDEGDEEEGVVDEAGEEWFL